MFLLDNFNRSKKHHSRKTPNSSALQQSTQKLHPHLSTDHVRNSKNHKKNSSLKAVHKKGLHSSP